MDSIIYLELNLVCALIVVVMVLNEKFHTANYRAMRNVFLTEAAFFLTDVAGDMIIGKTIPLWIVYSVDGLYFVLSVLGPMFWLTYVRLRVDEKYNKKNSHWVMIPMLVVAALALTASTNHQLFFVDVAGGYHRGNLYFLQPIVSMGYGVAAAVVAFRAHRRSESYEVRKIAVTLGCYPIFPLFAAVGDIFLPDIPIYCPVTTIAIIYVYLQLKDQLISRDALTNLNNRFEVERYLSEKKRNGMYLMVMDINHFKHINDTYGHKVGDQALQRVAAVLMDISSQYNLFCARYGGDEFLVALPPCEEAFVKEIKEEINRRVEASSQGGELNLSVSIGYFCCDFDTMTVDENFAQADRLMYEEKTANGSGRK